MYFVAEFFTLSIVEEITISFHASILFGRVLYRYVKEESNGKTKNYFFENNVFLCINIHIYI